MSEFILTSENKKTLHHYAEEFNQWIKSQKGQDNIKEHRDHEAYFKENLSPKKLKILDEVSFREIYKTLWASNVWGNKDWYIDNRLLAPNGLDNIKEALFNLLYGEGEISQKYDAFKGNIKGFGPSILTEILHFLFPNKYCLWNNKPKTVIPFLQLEIVPERYVKYNITKGKDYVVCIKALELVKNELSQYGVNDFIDLDIFFWHIFNDIMPKHKAPIEKPKTIIQDVKVTIDSHEAAEYYLLEIGNLLGFSTYTADKSKIYQNELLGEIAILQEPMEFGNEFTQSIAKQIDVIWFNQDDYPSHCFEVEHTTDIVNGLRRLVELKPYYTKFYTVASKNREEKFQTILNGIQFRSIKDRFKFISYEALGKLYEVTRQFTDLRMKILDE